MLNRIAVRKLPQIVPNDIVEGKRKINRVPPTAVFPKTKQPGHLPGCTFHIREMIVLFIFAVI